MTRVDLRRRLQATSPIDESDDAAWDAFVSTSPGGQYPQSTLWARVKSHSGWRSSRVTVSNGGRIAAGAQLLLRPLSKVGTIGYVPKGPLVPDGDVELRRVVLDALLARAARCRVRYLVLQPPGCDEALDRELVARGFAPTAEVGTPSATLRVDLRRSPEEILADMNESTRRNIRRGQSHGVTVRTGLDADVDTFSRMTVDAAQRKRFSLPPADYYAEMWRVLREGRHVELLLAELGGEPVSAMLVIAFGDTAFAHASAWTGGNSASKPNHVLQWAAMTWAREHGYDYFDVEGVDITIARALTDRLSKAPVDVPDSHATRFKIGFGGQLTSSSVAYEYVPNHLLRWAYRRVYPHFKASPVVNTVRRRLMQRIQSRRAPQASGQE